MKTTKRMLVAGLMAAVMVASTGLSVQTSGAGAGLRLDSVAYALPVDHTSGKQKKKDLEDGGYKCTYVATGFYECTKDGDTTYWCDAHGDCEPKPFRTTPGRWAPIAPRGDMVATAQ